MLTAGCARVDPVPDYRNLEQRVAHATGEADVYRPGDEARAAELVAEMLADGLSADEAARIALLNNPALQARLWDIGLAKADAVQAGLLSNPSLGLALRLPSGGGLANLELDLAQNLADLWQIPPRRHLAERELQRVVLETARQAVEVAAQARQRYHAAVAADRHLAIAKENHQITRKVLELTQARREAGIGSDLDVNLARGVMLETELEEKQARLEAAEARRELALVLGLPDEAERLVLGDALTEPATVSLDAEALIDQALSERLDVLAAEAAVEAAEAKLLLETRRVFPTLEVGLALERGERGRSEGRDVLADTARASIAAGRLTAPEIEPRSARRRHSDVTLGPSLSLEVPVFDQNQAGIARARYAWEQRRRVLEGLERTVCQEVRGAVDRARTACEVARFYHTKVLPQALGNLDMARESYHAGKASILAVLDAQRSYLQARQRHVTALEAAVAVLVDLERVVGIPLERLTATPAAPTTTVPVSPASSTHGDEP